MGIITGYDDLDEVCRAWAKNMKLAKKKAISLSGGERRRLEITRALVTEPSLLLLDEPFANIDPLAVNDVKKMIRHLKEMGISVLITDHNVRETLAITGMAHIMADGVILTEGDSDYLANDPEARKIYLGERFRM